MKNLLRLLILCLVLSCITTTGWAKEGKPKSKVKPFTLTETTEKLPPGFIGDDIIELSSTLLRAGEKDEYETTEEYQKRKNKILSGINNTIYAFTIPHEKQYDADRQLLEIKNEDFGVPENDGKFTITDTKSKVRSSNALFEFKIAYDEPHIDSLSRKETMHTFADLTYSHVSYEFVGRITLPIKEAKALTGQIGLLAICKLDDNSLYFPIKTDLQATSLFTSIIPVKLLGIWVYNTQTGEIYLKKSATEALPAANAQPEEQKAEE